MHDANIPFLEILREFGEPDVHDPHRRLEQSLDFHLYKDSSTILGVCEYAISLRRDGLVEPVSNRS